MVNKYAQELTRLTLTVINFIVNALMCTIRPMERAEMLLGRLVPKRILSVPNRIRSAWIQFPPSPKKVARYGAGLMWRMTFGFIFWFVGDIQLHLLKVPYLGLEEPAIDDGWETCLEEEDDMDDGQDYGYQATRGKDDNVELDVGSKAGGIRALRQDQEMGSIEPISKTFPTNAPIMPLMEAATIDSSMDKVQRVVSY